MDFRIHGLSATPFTQYYGLSRSALAAHNIIRYHCDQHPGFPDRIELRDALPGETLLLLNHVCQPAQTPYRASHAIFVREGATRTWDRINTIPPAMKNRIMSLRAFDSNGMMLDADIAEGETEIRKIINRFFNQELVNTIHAHNAKQGCFAACIERAD